MIAQQLILDDIMRTTVSPYEELLAYEYLYSRKGESLKKLSDATVKKGILPSYLLKERAGLFGVEGDYDKMTAYIDSKLGKCSFVVNGAHGWPEKLKDSARPAPVLYYRGDLGLVESKNVSIVGAREASDAGMSRAHAAAKKLIGADVTIVTGLAKGVDTAAAKAVAQSNGKGQIIGVIGTPIDEYYPRENRQLQDWVAERNLLLSQVPFYKYKIQPFTSKRNYFPERNELMAAVSDATVVVEASDRSGVLHQAKACLRMGRPLFIMRSCAENPAVSWPSRFIGKPGVQILDDISQVLEAISA